MNTGAATTSTVELAALLRGARLEMAPLQLRLVAGTIDAVVAATLAAVPIGTALLLLSVDGSLRVGSPALLVSYVVAFCVTVIYGIVWPDLAVGTTPGKDMVGLRVARADGSLPAVRDHTVRWLLLGVDLLGPGLLLALLRHDHRRLGDLVAGTCVVRTR